MKNNTIIAIILFHCLTWVTIEKANGQDFPEEDRVAIADSVELLLGRFTKSLFFSEDNRGDSSNFIRTFTQLFDSRENTIPNFAFPDSIHQGTTIEAADFASLTANYLHRLSVETFIQYFNAPGFRLRPHANKMRIVRASGGRHRLQIPISLLNLEVQYGLGQETFTTREGNTQSNYRWNRLNLIAEVVFESSIRGRNPRRYNVHDFKIEKLSIPDSEQLFVPWTGREWPPDTEHHHAAEEITDHTIEEDTQETEWVEKPCRDFQLNLNAADKERARSNMLSIFSVLLGLETGESLLGLRDPTAAQNHYSIELIGQLTNLFENPLAPSIEARLFDLHGRSELLSLNEYIELLLNGRLEIRNLYRANNETEPCIYFELSKTCKNLIHAFIEDELIISGWRYAGDDRIAFSNTFKVILQFDLGATTSFRSDEIGVFGMPRIRGMSNREGLFRCEPPPLTWNLSAGLQYQHGYNFFQLADNHIYKGSFDTEPGLSSNVGLMVSYHRLSNTRWQWGVSAGFFYHNIAAKLFSDELSDSRFETHKELEMDYIQHFSATNISQSFTYTSLEIPFTFHTGLTLNTKTYLNLAIGAQMNINSKPDLKQCENGFIRYSGEFLFFDNQQAYLLDDIPELGFMTKEANLASNRVDITDLTFGLRGSLVFGRRLSETMPIYLELGPQLYYALNETFETYPTTMQLIGNTGLVENAFQQLTNGKNYMGSFVVGVRYFFR